MRGPTDDDLTHDDDEPCPATAATPDRRPLPPTPADDDEALIEPGPPGWTPTPPHPGRDARQRDLVPPAALAACRAVVVGVGAVGRQVAAQLAALGVPALSLVDDDVVAAENLAPQAYCPADLGRPKVDATADWCRALNPAAAVTARAERFKRSAARSLPPAGAGGAPATAVFCCVDSIATRGLVWDAVRDRAAFWADGRMAAEVVRVLASGSPAADAFYATTLFDPARAYAGACTGRSTVYAANVAAGLMVGQFARWLRGLPVDRDLTLNLLASELTAG